MHRANSAASILNDHLRSSLRELLGGTYSPSVRFGNPTPIGGYSTMSLSGITEKDLALTIEEEFATLAKVLTPQNINDYVTTIPHDRDVVGVSPERQAGAARASRWN